MLGEVNLRGLSPSVASTSLAIIGQRWRYPRRWRAGQSCADEVHPLLDVPISRVVANQPVPSFGPRIFRLKLHHRSKIFAVITLGSFS